MNEIALPDIPIVVLDGEGALWLSPDGDFKHLNKRNAAAELAASPVIGCNGPLLRERLHAKDAVIFDVLELFAFVRPAKFCVPTPNGIARALDLPLQAQAAQQALGLVTAVEKLLGECAQLSEPETVTAIAQAMASAAPVWHWSPFVLQALGIPLTDNLAIFTREKVSVWRKLPEWEERPPLGPTPHKPITPSETRQELQRLVEAVIGRKTGQIVEPRPEQADYASALTAAFAPQNALGKPNWIMAEAGTGVGKTLGYLAPSLTWAAKNDAQVWISTFTRHLQNQLQHDLDQIFPLSNPPQALIRKGRENYMCLLNFEENIEQCVTGDYKTRIGFGLMLRWLMATRDGDLTGGDLPGWLPTLVGSKPTTQLSDRRGECIHQACPHYQRCFIERIQRNSKDATVIVANHALTLTQITSNVDEHDENARTLPTRLVFDEGHHLFEAADSAFSTLFSGAETAEMKRWLIGDNAQKRLRRRGLTRRLMNLVGETHPLWEYVPLIREAAAFLPETGWLERIHKDMPKGLAEEFFAAIRRQILARADFPNSPYDLECIVLPLEDEALLTGKKLAKELQTLFSRVDALRQDLVNLQKGDDKQVKRQVGTFLRSLQTRILDPLSAWAQMITQLPMASAETVVTWLGITRINGRDADIGLWQHFLDPMQVFVEQTKDKAQGVVITSATLKPAQGDNEQNWHQAEQRLGGHVLRCEGNAPLRVQIPSPFNYARQTKVILITDVDSQSTQDVALAYADLFKAAGGGGLGLFTAIKRLQAAHPILQHALSQAHLPLYAQHVDGLNTATLVDIFRAEEDACLLGTDALRDGVDVPGRALRLVVYDRIPWQRPSILHKARRAHFGAREYDLFLTSMRLRQSFGRLIRTGDDQGVFVLMESALPSALHKAFPDGVEIKKLPLEAAIAEIQGFLNPIKTARIIAQEV